RIQSQKDRNHRNRPKTPHNPQRYAPRELNIQISMKQLPARAALGQRRSNRQGDDGEDEIS
ncbi:MAG: hypothetical protein ACK4K8_17715, partial [Pannonibacter sp.]